jgi:hypothetical protein
VVEIPLNASTSDAPMRVYVARQLILDE